MNDEYPLIETMTDVQLEDWLAGAGISARVVAACPLSDCAACLAPEDLAPAA